MTTVFYWLVVVVCCSQRDENVGWRADYDMILYSKCCCCYCCICYGLVDCVVHAVEEKTAANNNNDCFYHFVIVIFVVFPADLLLLLQNRRRWRKRPLMMATFSGCYCCWVPDDLICCYHKSSWIRIEKEATFERQGETFLICYKRPKGFFGIKKIVECCKLQLFTILLHSWNKGDCHMPLSTLGVQLNFFTDHEQNVVVNWCNGTWYISVQQ